MHKTSNGQSRDTDNIGCTRRRKTKQKINTKCVGHHHTQASTNNVNRIWALLQTTTRQSCSCGNRNELWKDSLNSAGQQFQGMYCIFYIFYYKCLLYHLRSFKTIYWYLIVNDDMMKGGWFMSISSKWDFNLKCIRSMKSVITSIIND
jgi:hypothetical protein